MDIGQIGGHHNAVPLASLRATKSIPLILQKGFDEMTDGELLQGLNDVFREVFEDDTIVLTPDTTADDVERWDSMSQITLAVEIEHRFHIKIRSARMEEMRSVAGLMKLIRLLSPATAS